MQHIPPLPGFNFVKLPYEDLLARYFAIPEWTNQQIGTTVNGRPIYAFYLGDPSKPTIYVEGNIHGWHEWRTSYWVSEFMKLLVDHKTIPQRPIFEYLRSKYSFCFVPSINADGYGTPTQNGPYTNANGVSLSENFDFNWEAGKHTPPSDEYRGPAPFSEPESQAVRDTILAAKPVSLLCCHTWSSSTIGYTTRHPQNAGDDRAITDWWRTIRIQLGYADDYTQTFSAKLPTGSVYNWAGTLTSPAGRPTITQVWECGGGAPEYEQARMGVNGILNHMRMVDQLLTTGTQA